MSRLKKNKVQWRNTITSSAINDDSIGNQHIGIYTSQVVSKIETVYILSKTGKKCHKKTNKYCRISGLQNILQEKECLYCEAGKNKTNQSKTKEDTSNEKKRYKNAVQTVIYLVFRQMVSSLFNRVQFNTLFQIHFRHIYRGTMMTRSWTGKSPSVYLCCYL